MKSGVLFPISSFPSNHGIGDFGENAYQIIDQLSKYKLDYLQILPFHPSFQANSPYRAISIYAGDEIYIDLNELVTMKLLKEVPDFHKDDSKVHYDEIRKFKRKYLLEAYKNFRQESDYSHFLEQCPWVNDYAIFCSFADYNNTYDWTSWPEEQKKYPQNKQVDLSSFQFEIGYYKFVQYIFYKQWFSLKKYANERNIKIVGDMPFYVDHGSVEVWLSNNSFLLDEQGHPTDVAGVPPDYFSETGQYWGNPIYNWDYLENHDFSFWVERVAWANKIFDITRIDHFRAFDTYWDIPATSSSAVNGHWCYSPGYKLFDCLYAKLGNVSLVAEDLGYLRKEVIELRDHYNLKGMKVFQFMLNEGYNDLGNCFFYTGTHDNETLKGWISNLDCEAKKKLESYIGDTKLSLNLEIIKYCLHSDASDVIIPIWDLLGAENNQRFNVPGEVNDTNWTYRILDVQSVETAINLFDELRKED